MNKGSQADNSVNSGYYSRLSEEERSKRNEYKRQWYQKNKDKHYGYMMRYWMRKAEELRGGNT